MIDFSNFYQLIAKSPLSHWLETLPAQVAAWQRDALHGKFREWERAVEFLPELTPWRLDLLHSVTEEFTKSFGAKDLLVCLGAHNRCHLQMMSGYPGSRWASRGFWNAAFYPLPPGRGME